MPVPEETIKKIKKRQCILFLGAMASAPSPKGSPFDYKKAPPSGGVLSEYLAGKSGYPDKDTWNLQRVSLHYEHNKGGRENLIDTIKEFITRDQSTGEVYKPSPALSMLAKLPFPIIITTNYDGLFDIALRRANTREGVAKDPIERIYNPGLKASPENVPLDIEEEQPVLMKLHGDFESKESIVITEEDYIRFIQKMSDSHHHPLPSSILARLASWSILFIGYSLKDYNLRLLFKTIEFSTQNRSLPLSYSVDPYPDDLIVTLMGEGAKKTVDFIESDLWSFVPELYKEVMGKEYQI